MKNYILFLSYFLFSILNTSCSQNKQTELNSESISQQLTTIDKNQDINSLKKMLDEDILLYIPDAPIIYSKEVVLDLFKYSWERNKNNTNIKYTPKSIEQNSNVIIEKGTYSYTNSTGKKIEMPYSLTGIKKGKAILITEIIYGNSKKELEMLPKPTGNYNIGQSIHFYEKNGHRNRPLSFQIWYPTLVNSNQKIPFQSKNVALAVCNFLGWPSFNNSFTRLIKTNAVKEVPIVANKKFPIVVYNHGYGGASSVYQTVFEELASHGYIVVSLGHQDESAFLIKEDGSIIENSPQNKFYKKRAPELNNRTIGIEQATILNSDNAKELTKAYKKLVQLSPLHTKSVNLWVADTENVLNLLQAINIENEYLKGGFDFTNMGIFGHSVGGATAGQLGTKNTFKAGINIDGFQFGSLIDSNLKIPFLFISSNEEGNRYLRVAPFAKEAKKVTYQAIIKGFSHGSFSDLQLFTPKGNLGIELQRKLILSFFNKYLKKENINLKLLSNQFNELTVKKWNVQFN